MKCSHTHPYSFSTIHPYSVGVCVNAYIACMSRVSSGIHREQHYLLNINNRTNSGKCDDMSHNSNAMHDITRS